MFKRTTHPPAITSRPVDRVVGQPLPIYEGPVEAYAVDPAEPYYKRGGPTDHYIMTSLVIDSRDYDDAIQVYIDGIEKNEPFYLDAENTRALIVMLSRDLLKLERIIQLDPEDS